MTLISVIVPLFNEAEVLPVLHVRLSRVLTAMECGYEILFVDDGSDDGSAALLAAIVETDKNARLLTLSRNFGHQIAITAGIEHAEGDAVVVMDADLQDPPEFISTMIEQWKAGFDVVYAVRRARDSESFGKRWSASIFYRLLRALSPLNIPVDSGDFRLMSRRVVEQLARLPERNRFMRGLVAWVGFKQIGITYDRAPRAGGNTKYPLREMIRLASDALFGFSRLPLQLSVAIGLFLSAACFAYGAVAVWSRWAHDQPIPEWNSLIVAIVFVGGVQLVSLGIIGEYIGRIYEEVRQRPLYIIEKITGPGRLPPHTSPITAPIQNQAMKVPDVARTRR